MGFTAKTFNCEMHAQTDVVGSERHDLVDDVSRHFASRVVAEEYLEKDVSQTAKREPLRRRNLLGLVE